MRLQCKNDEDEAAEIMSYSSESLLSMASDVRHWASLIPDEARHQEIPKLSAVSSTLEHWGTEIKILRGELQLHSVTGHFKHSATKLLRCIQMLYFAHCGSSKLVRIVQDCRSPYPLKGYIGSDIGKRHQDLYKIRLHVPACQAGPSKQLLNGKACLYVLHIQMYMHV